MEKPPKCSECTHWKVDRKCECTGYYKNGNNICDCGQFIMRKPN